VLAVGGVGVAELLELSAFVGDEVRIEVQIEAVKQEPEAQPPPAGA